MLVYFHRVSQYTTLKQYEYKVGTVSMIVCIISAILVVLTSCEVRTEKVIDNYGAKWTVLEIDSCEYLYDFYGRAGFLAHKGNCKYCEERRKSRNENY